MKPMYVYILTNHHNTTFYIGVTNDLVRRIYEHKNNMDMTSFSAKYQLHKLIYFETYDDEIMAISREKFLKKAYKKEKIKLITDMNPQWRDLYEDICK